MIEGAGAAGWMEVERDRLAKETRLSCTGDRVTDVSARPGREFEFTGHGRVLRARLLDAGARRYEVTASAPRWGEDQRRFFESFALTDSLAPR